MGVQGDKATNGYMHASAQAGLAQGTVYVLEYTPPPAAQLAAAFELAGP